MTIFKFTTFLICLIFLQANCLRPSQESFCPSQCTSSENGRCSARFKRCLCNRGFFGKDCEQQALSFSNQISQTISVSPTSWEYFYLEIDYTMEDLKFEFETSHLTLEYSFLLQDPEESILPDKNDSRTLRISSSGEPSQTVTINKLELKEFEGGFLLLAIQNLDAQETATIKITHNWETENTSTSFEKSTDFLTLGLMFGALVVFSIAVAKILGVEFVEEEDGTIIITRNPENKKPKAPFTIEDLDASFPIKRFEDLEVVFEQTSCTICLATYHPQDNCRSLACEHIFHHQCIEDWLAKNNCCPLCKTKINSRTN